MSGYGFTDYAENHVLRKRPYLQKEWSINVCQNPIRMEKQKQNRYSFLSRIKELDNRVLSVVTLDDNTTIHNASPDWRFKP